jgi:hypothetical protein
VYKPGPIVPRETLLAVLFVESATVQCLISITRKHILAARAREFSAKNRPPKVCGFQLAAGSKKVIGR